MLDQSREKVCKTISKTSQVLWCVLVIPATWEVEIGGQWSMASSRQKFKTLPEKLKQEGLGLWLKW
jgi:hypothetical protein